MVWKKRLRALLGLLVLLTAGGVTWYIARQRPAVSAPPGSPRTDDLAETEISGEDHVRQDADGKVIFRLKYARGFTYPAQSRIRLVNVTGTMMRNSQPIEFRADEADVKLKSGAMMDPQKFDEIRLKGHVLIKSGPGAEVLHLETSEALYNDLTGIMTTDKPVKIKRGNMSGSGTGATFDRNRSVVWLLADARVSMALEGEAPLSTTSARAGLA